MLYKHGLDVKIVQGAWKPNCSDQQSQRLWFSYCTGSSTSHASHPQESSAHTHTNTQTQPKDNLSALAWATNTTKNPHPLLRIHDSGVLAPRVRRVAGFHLLPRLGLTALLQQKTSSLNSQRDVMLKKQIAVANSEVCQASWDFQKQLLSKRWCIPVNQLASSRCWQNWSKSKLARLKHHPRK